jgi:hypothetical protein
MPLGSELPAHVEGEDPDLTTRRLLCDMGTQLQGDMEQVLTELNIASLMRRFASFQADAQQHGDYQSMSEADLQDALNGRAGKEFCLEAERREIHRLLSAGIAIQYPYSATSTPCWLSSAWSAKTLRNLTHPTAGLAC